MFDYVCHVVIHVKDEEAGRIIYDKMYPLSRAKVNKRTGRFWSEMSDYKVNKVDDYYVSEFEVVRRHILGNVENDVINAVSQTISRYKIKDVRYEVNTISRTQVARPDDDPEFKLRRRRKES